MRRMFALLVLGLTLAPWVCAVGTAGPLREPVSAATGAALVENASALEAAFSARAGEPLRQFGYDLFAQAADSRPLPGAVQGDYVLNTGDELLVTLRGQKSFSKRFAIDSGGLLLVDEIRPVTAAGLTLAALRAELSAAVTAALPNTDTFVSLADVRRIGIVVTGSVGRPGRQEVSAFATVLDALSTAGGVTRAGSLRRIRLIRAGDAEGGRTIDLYDLHLTGGESAGGAGQRLRDGDRLFVPPLGPTAAVAGPVKRPGIYELAPGQPRLSATELRELAGGVLRPGPQRVLRFGIAPSGEEAAEEVGDPQAPLFGDGDLLLLTPQREDRRNEVRLEGHVHRPGPRALARSGRLSALVARSDLRPDPYLPFAALATTDPATRARVLRAVDLAAVLKGRDDRRLAEGDTLYVLGAGDVDFLTSEPVLDLLRGDRALPSDACQGLVVLGRALAASPDGPLATGRQARAAAGLTGSRGPCPPLFEAVPDLLAFALERSVLLLGGVPRPGFYPRAGRAAAGGASALARAAGDEPEGLEWVDPAEDGEADGRGAILESTVPHYELVGHVRRPGTRPLTGRTTLRTALGGGEAMKRGVYPLLGVIERFDRRTLTRSLIPFSPQEVGARRADRALADGDRIHLFPAARLHSPPRSAQEAGTAPSVPKRDDPPDSEPLDPAIAALIAERTVQVRGAVRQPGGYPVADQTPLSALIAVAGGLSSDADPTSVELTAASGARTAIDLGRTGNSVQSAGPGDAIRVNPRAQALEARAVTIQGAVRRPGSYDVGRGETLSSLIARAGGLTEDAYPAGAVFTRESERRREKEQFTQQARELERALTLEIEKGDPVKAENVALARQLAAQLRGAEPLGRIVVEADPAVLRARPELDPLLESDDRIHIPKRPLSVAVAGEVMHPTAAQFVSGKSAEAYLEEAGGPTRNADPGRSFLILPDGRAQPLALSSWNHRVSTVPPGAILVVPRDPKPFDSLEFTKSVGGILGQLAITAASIAVISR
ncbi:protein involved in polysaccharide export with SLBB domain [Azospirillum agricola]|uniref:SLBB domain-containing protein n=1 Tax=Azospirillum agricola TaxID=1720247 RepID=UPI001F199CC4|nr:SLBB domain-containing protein [Azospirillum agricola]MBP2226934.1 protein involved in polysaccharide export with SLBB domain [Azospirillum agricola]